VGDGRQRRARSFVSDDLERYRALFAFIKGTGCDVGSALRAQGR
jgi:hypothetical protein